MKERPILFNGEMVRAILEGRKTQTRRILQVQPPSDEYQITTLADSTAREDRKHIGAHHYAIVKDLSIVEDHGKYFRCPYGKPGDRLWVRETWRTDASLDHKSPRLFTKWPVEYLADGCSLEHGAIYGHTDGKLRPSIFMPRWASRITLEITRVRVERLQEISEKDAEKEGCERMWPMGNGYYGGSNDSEKPSPMHTYRGGFRYLWDRINDKRASWESNPWVWVIEFKKV